MSDADRIPGLLALAANPNTLEAAQKEAALELYRFDGEKYPADGCAITQSTLLRQAGIDVPFTFQALALDKLLQSRGWLKIPVGQQKAGDLGSTCVAYPRHGSDHIYLVLHDMNGDEMIIADNQATAPHLRAASGAGGKTPTTHFLRAPTPAPAAVQGPSGTAQLGAPSAPAAKKAITAATKKSARKR